MVWILIHWQRHIKSCCKSHLGKHKHTFQRYSIYLALSKDWAVQLRGVFSAASYLGVRNSTYNTFNISWKCSSHFGLQQSHSMYLVVSCPPELLSDYKIINVVWCFFFEPLFLIYHIPQQNFDNTKAWAELRFLTLPYIQSLLVSHKARHLNKRSSFLVVNSSSTIARNTHVKYCISFTYNKVVSEHTKRRQADHCKCLLHSGSTMLSRLPNPYYICVQYTLLLTLNPQPCVAVHSYIQTCILSKNNFVKINHKKNT